MEEKNQANNGGGGWIWIPIVIAGIGISIGGYVYYRKTKNVYDMVVSGSDSRRELQWLVKMNGKKDWSGIIPMSDIKDGRNVIDDRSSNYQIVTSKNGNVVTFLLVSKGFLPGLKGGKVLDSSTPITLK